MSSQVDQKTVVTVRIGEDEYTIRTDASADYTERCAAYVNQTIDEIVQQGSLVEAHKAAILAALALTDQLFQAREETAGVRAEIARVANRLADDVGKKLEEDDVDLASSP
ncbi:MAG: cell division protein ZapA [Gemmatimonadota bacterium]